MLECSLGIFLTFIPNEDSKAKKENNAIKIQEAEKNEQINSN